MHGTLLNAAAAAACFGFGWLSLCALATPLFPRELPVSSEKRAHFFAHRGEYDAVFFGSSRVYHGIVPRVFDAEMRARGHAVRSFNFAMDGVWPPESFYRVREFLRARPRVRWVFVELLPINPRISPENARTLRAIDWHDWRHTVLAWRQTAGEPSFTSPQKRAWHVLHAGLFLQRFSHVSRGAALLGPRLRPELEKTERRQRAQNWKWVDDEGFVAEPATPMSPADAESLRRSAAARARDLTPVPLQDHLREELRDLASAIRVAGAAPVFFITPSTTRAERFTDWPKDQIGADLLSFKDPARFPALYDPALHFDAPHLNERGARELSRLLAEEFAASLSGDSTRP